MENLFSNPWIIGIGGGILSGFIVTISSRALLSRKDQREYIQKVLSANREVIYAIRPGISEGLMPSYEVIDALINSTARKYGVDAKDVFDLNEVAQELIKEVMDSSFISAKTKEQYCEELSKLSHREIKEETIDYEATINKQEIRPSRSIEDYRTRMIQTMSIMLGVLVSMLTFISVFSRKDFVVDSLFANKNATLFLPMLIALLAVTMVTFVSYLYRDLLVRKDRDKKRNHEEKNDSSESNN